MTDPQPHFTFNASDAMSGIEFFDVTIDEKHIGVWPENKGRVYTPTPQGPGKHTILVKAVDRAGNYAVSSADFDIEPIDSVRITEYPKEVESGDIIVIGGDGKPNVGVNVYLERTGDAPIKVIARANAQGTFEIAIDKRLKNGAYSFYAEAEDERGAKSKPTDIYTIRIQPSTIIRIGSLALSFMTIFVPLLGFIFFLVFLIWFLLHRLRRMKKVVRKELVHVEAVVHKSFVDLKKQMKDAAGFLERVKNKRDLSEEEDRLLKQLRSYIDSAEESIDKEVEHLKEDL
jgi:hypothetical protein